jgi:hypothetical protein
VSIPSHLLSIPTKRRGFGVFANAGTARNLEPGIRICEAGQYERDDNDLLIADAGLFGTIQPG